MIFLKVATDPSVLRCSQKMKSSSPISPISLVIFLLL